MFDRTSEFALIEDGRGDWVSPCSAGGAPQHPLSGRDDEGAQDASQTAYDHGESQRERPPAIGAHVDGQVVK